MLKCMTDLLADRSSPGFPEDSDDTAEAAQSFCEESDLSAFAATLCPFEGDESASHLDFLGASALWGVLNHPTFGLKFVSKGVCLLKIFRFSGGLTSLDQV